MKTVFIVIFLIFCRLINAQIIYFQDHFDSLDINNSNQTINGTNYIDIFKKSIFIEKTKKEFDDLDKNYLNIIGKYNTVLKSYISKESDNSKQYEIHSEDIEELDSIINKVNYSNVLIINEEHNREETRAYNLWFIQYLKTKGFTHLAMEAFHGNNKFDFPNSQLGYYFQDPIQTEIFRLAKELGYKFIAYDTFCNNVFKRDSLQAYNLFTRLPKDINSKTIVIAGQSHGCDDLPMYPQLMGMILKSVYKLDPITIDQTRGFLATNKEDIKFKNKDFLNQYIKADNIKKQKGFSLFDYFFIHPNYNLDLQKPSWYLSNGIKKTYFYKYEKKLKPCLIEIYYKNEFKGINENIPTPAEIITQTNSKQELELHLRPYKNYIIVYKDKNNNILYTEDFKAE